MIDFYLMGVAIAQTEMPPSIAEHVDLMWVILIAALGYIVYHGGKVAKEVCETVKNHEKRLTVIETKHNDQVGMHGKVIDEHPTEV